MKLILNNWGIMRRTVIFWILSVIITLAGAYYQRVTGPTYPLSGKIKLDRSFITYNLARSHNSGHNYSIKINTNGKPISGEMAWKRYKTDDKWTNVKMTILMES